MSEKRDVLTRCRGRWILTCEIFVVGIILFLTYTHKPTVTIQASHFWITDNGVFDEKGGTDLFEEKTKKKLLNSKWIDLFPDLKHMVTQIGGDSYQHMTSATQTILTVNHKRGLNIGEEFIAKIIARDEFGRQKSYGGDFFIVTLRREAFPDDGITCEVFDEMNGTYKVTCMLPWPGKVYLNAILVHPSESIYQMMNKYSSEHEFGVVMNTTMRNSNSEDEFTDCSVGFPEKSASELCDYSNPSHGEKWTCIKPASGECSNIKWQVKKTLKTLKYFDTLYFRKGFNLYAEIGGSRTIITGTVMAKSKNVKDNIYQTDNPFKPTGWFKNSRWISTVISYVPYSVERMKQCSTNKDFYFLGDSTIRQWHEHFASTLEIRQYGPDNSVAWSQRRDGRGKNMNTSLHYRSHGSPLHNPGPLSSRPYISDSLDSIKQAGKGTIVIITIGLHFELYDADVYGNRIRTIKKSLQSLLKRSPGIQFFIKGLNHHAYSTLCPSAWLTYRYDVMLRNEFKDLSGVTYLPFWDLSIAANNKVLHPQKQLLQTQIALFLSYIC